MNELDWIVEAKTSNVIMEALICRYQEFIVKVTHKIVGTSSFSMVDFDDFCQEANIAFIHAVKTYEFDAEGKSAKFSTYAYTVIRNHLLNMLKKERMIQWNHKLSLELEMGDSDSDAELKDFIPDEKTDVALEIEIKHMAEEIRLQCEKIFSKQEFQVFDLYLQDCSYKEIADMLCLSEKAVDSTMLRCRKKIKEIQAKV